MDLLSNTPDETALAEELAEVYQLLDLDPRLVDFDQKNYLYGVAASNPKIHYLALRINNTRYQNDKRQQNGSL